MKFYRRLYHFLGGVVFALMLIACTAVFVIAGTLIESSTQSHQYAAQFTYSSPLFGILLWCFFINILFAATRRWPFQVRHIPFLITHLGLLMILSGVLIKHYFGLQGNMGLIEGSGSQEVFENGTYALQLESKDNPVRERFPLKRSFGSFNHYIGNSLDGLQVFLEDFTPHSTDQFSTWIKGDHAYIFGLDPLPVHRVVNNDEAFPVSGRVRFQPEGAVWNLFALRALDLENSVRKVYLQGARLRFIDRSTGLLLKEIPLQEADHSPFDISGQGMASVAFLFSPDFVNSKLQVNILNESASYWMTIHLLGSLPLINQNEMTSYLGSIPIAVDIVREPTLAIIEDDKNDCHLVVVDAYGKMWWKQFKNEMPDTLLSYDDGFKGYGIRAQLPPSLFYADRKHLEEALAGRIKRQLHRALNENIPLSPPLQLFKGACEKAGVDFVDHCVEFLIQWDASHSWLYAEELPLPHKLADVMEEINWIEVPEQEIHGCHWSSTFFSFLEPDLRQGMDVMEILRKQRWPLLASLEHLKQSEGPCTSEASESLLTAVTQQLFAAAVAKPGDHPLPLKQSPQHTARLFSAYLRAYGIHLKTILTPPASEEELDTLLREHYPEKVETSPIVLETTLRANHVAAPASKKLEDNIPKITLVARTGDKAQRFSLSYDRYGTGLKWPILDGHYLVRFQPVFTEIPYRVRLRNARQINYPHSSQAFSYESDLIFTDRRTGQNLEKTISMNKVHETWDGYRFYLASIAPGEETAVKRIQLVVNYDPAKYFLTYPGAIILSMGILLLFWMRPYRQKDEG